MALAILFSLFIVWVIISADESTLPHAIHALYNFPNGDKVGHFILYGLLNLIWTLTLLPRPRPNAKRIILLSGLVLAALVGLEEWSQSLFASRTMDIFDLLASYSGLTVAALIVYRMRNARPSPEINRDEQ